MNKKLFCTLCLLAALAHYPFKTAWAEAYGSGWYGETQLSVGHEDNISRSYKQEDLVSDNISSFSIGAGHARKIGYGSQLILSGYLSVNYHDEYRDLDSLATSLQLQFIRQPNIGFSAMWYDISLSATRMDYRNSDPREGYLFEGDLSLNKRLSSRTTGHVGYRYADLVFLDKSNKEEAEAAAFDTATNELYLGADYELASRIFLYAQYGYRLGGFTSSVSGIPDGSIVYEAESADPAFESCINARCSHRYAYRSDGDIQSVDLGIAFPLWGVNFDLSGRYYDAEGSGDTTYRDWFVQLGAIWNF
jgi:hypothetical protein